MACFNYYIKYTFYLFVLSHACACTRILGEINAFANSTRGNTTMGARGGGGQEEALNRSHPPLKIKEIFFPLYGVIFASFNFSMWGLFYYVFLIIVIALRGGGGNSRQSPPLKNLLFAWTPFCCLFAAFSLPFFPCEGFLLRFSHYNFALAEGGGESKTWRLPLPKK